MFMGIYGTVTDRGLLRGRDVGGVPVAAVVHGQHVVAQGEQQLVHANPDNNQK